MPPSETTFQWAGRKGYFFDSELASYYIRARVYEAHISRWISYDPIGLSGGTVMYSYAFNRPLVLRDSSGLAPSRHEGGSGNFEINRSSPRMVPTILNAGAVKVDVVITYQPSVKCCVCKTVDLIQIVKRQFYKGWKDPFAGVEYSKGDNFPEDGARGALISEVSWDDWVIDISPENKWFFEEWSPFYNDTVLSDFNSPSSKCVPGQVVMFPNDPTEYGAWQPLATLKDTPSSPYFKVLGRGIDVAPLEFSFETCAVCKESRKCPTNIPFILGCVNWGFKFQSN